jgi:DNA-binding NtrC family response regulator
VLFAIAHEAFPGSVRKEPTWEATMTMPDPLLIEDGWPTLEELGRRYVRRAFERAGGNKTRTAELLGIDRRTVGRILGHRMKRWEQASAVAAAPAEATPAAPG